MILNRNKIISLYNEMIKGEKSFFDKYNTLSKYEIDIIKTIGKNYNDGLYIFNQLEKIIFPYIENYTDDFYTYDKKLLLQNGDKMFLYGYRKNGTNIYYFGTGQTDVFLLNNEKFLLCVNSTIISINKNIAIQLIKGA